MMWMRYAWPALRCWMFLLPMLLASCQSSGPASEFSVKNLEPAPVRLVAGLGPVHHPVTTASPEAQQFFDQGLAYIYAFNHEQAVRSFEKAAELDPRLAMAHWGKALALGPNINAPQIDHAAARAAYEAAQTAQSLADNATAAERAYITALASRYSPDTSADLRKLAEAYAAAMKEVARQNPQDLDAATLYAESLMNLRPWKLYTKDGQPEPGTQEIVQALEWVLTRNPSHTGANHYYIHATEASNSPQRALDAARRLPQLAPAAGHLVHMPAHVYIRTGDYAAAIKANADAAAVDEKFISCCGPKEASLYPALYYSHNLHFLAVAAAMAGRSAQATEACERLSRHLEPLARNNPIAEGFGAIPMLVAARQGQWGLILKAPAPPTGWPVTQVSWHFARAMAHASMRNIGPALQEQALFDRSLKDMPEMPLGNNTTRKVMSVAQHVLFGRIAVARGDLAEARAQFETAVALQDGLAYDEPPAWPWPARESLGAVLIAGGDPAAAEAVFRRDLEKNLKNPRSLLGLAEALRARGRHEQSDMIRREFEAAWRDADMKLRLEDL